jgi:hypothetical protein
MVGAAEIEQATQLPEIASGLLAPDGHVPPEVPPPQCVAAPTADPRCTLSPGAKTRTSAGASSSAWASRRGHRDSSRRTRPALLQPPGSKRLKLQASSSHRRMTGLLAPDHPDEPARNPAAPASAEPSAEGSAARAISLMRAQGEPQGRDEAAGALNSPRIWPNRSWIGARCHPAA